MKDEKVYLNQIIESIAIIEDFTRGMNREGFLADRKTQSSVLMQLILIGELSKKISMETKKNVDLPWKDIAGFRDRAIHDYYQIDLKLVWETVENDLPVLKSKLKFLIE